MKNRSIGLTILSFLHLLLAIGWLNPAVGYLSLFFNPLTEITISSGPGPGIVGLFFGGGVIYYLYLFWGFLRQNKKIMTLAGETSIYLFFIILVFWLPRDLARGGYIQISVSVSYLMINLIIWYLSKKLIFPENGDKND